MINKKIIILEIFLICLLTISAVNAVENVTDSIVSVNATDKVVNVEETAVDTVSIENQDNNLTADNNNLLNINSYTFTDLNRIINNNEDSEVYLEGNYVFKQGTDNNFKDGIRIDRAVTIYGKGYTINGANTATVFNIYDPNVIIRDVVFINCNGSLGSAIHSLWGCYAINCNFTNNIAEKGGAIFSGNPINCTFTNNIATESGGAIYYGDFADYKVTNCTFINNKATNRGGAIYNTDLELCNVTNCTFINNEILTGPGGATYGVNVYNCNFTNNNAIGGGAVYAGSAINCNFTNNYAIGGGAIFNGDAINCTFTNNTAKENGGAIYNGNAINCTFTNNTAEINDGGAIYGNYNIVITCIFINNTASQYGGAIYRVNAYNCNFTNNKATSGGAMYRGDAITSIFTNNTAKENGGAIYGDEYYYKNTATNCIFKNNSAENGGAVYMTIAEYCDFTNNKATEKGGAIYDGTAKYCFFIDNKASLEGNDAYASDLTKIATKLTAPTIKVIYNNLGYLIITLKDQYNNPFIGYEISVNINGKTTKFNTNSNGQVKTPTKTLAPGTYNAKITFDGDINYAKSTLTSKIVVKKATPKLVASKKIFKKSLKINKYVVTLKSHQNKVMKNAWITLKVNKKNYKIKTNAKGQAIFKITNLKKKGNFKVIVKYAGNKYYNSKTVNSRITVK